MRHQPGGDRGEQHEGEVHRIQPRGIGKQEQFAHAEVGVTREANTIGGELAPAEVGDRPDQQRHSACNGKAEDDDDGEGEAENRSCVGLTCPVKKRQIELDATFAQAMAVIWNNHATIDLFQEV